MDNSPQQRIYTEPVFLPDEVRSRLESLLPHLSDFSLADANFLLGARGKIELGERLNRSELFPLNSIQQQPLAARTPLAAGGEVVLRIASGPHVKGGREGACAPRPNEMALDVGKGDEASYTRRTAARVRA